jgi:hypothetical protein
VVAESAQQVHPSTTSEADSVAGLEGTEKEWSGGGSWILSTVLLAAGGLAGAIAILFAFFGAFGDPADASSGALIAAATPVALGGLALAAVGGVLRYCCMCWDDCDWDDDETPTMTPVMAPKKG